MKYMRVAPFVWVLAFILTQFLVDALALPPEPRLSLEDFNSDYLEIVRKSPRDKIFANPEMVAGFSRMVAKGDTSQRLIELASDAVGDNKTALDTGSRVFLVPSLALTSDPKAVELISKLLKPLPRNAKSRALIQLSMVPSKIARDALTQTICEAFAEIPDANEYSRVEEINDFWLVDAGKAIARAFYYGDTQARTEMLELEAWVVNQCRNSPHLYQSLTEFQTDVQYALDLTQTRRSDYLGEASRHETAEALSHDRTFSQQRSGVPGTEESQLALSNRSYAPWIVMLSVGGVCLLLLLIIQRRNG